MNRPNFRQMHNFVKCISAMADDLVVELEQIEKRLAEAEKESGGPARLYLMPDRKEVVQ
jgi:hypothetical protein